MKTLFCILLAVALCSISRAQNINVQADATTGLLWRPSTLFSNSTNAAEIRTAAGIPSFSGNSLKLLRLNAGETALEFVAGGAGTGSVTDVSVVTANGVSATVANPSTTPALTFTLGAITPSSVASTGAIGGTTGTFSALTAGRVPIVSTAGLLADDADLTFSGDTLTATKGNFGLMTFISNVITSSSTNTLELLGGVGGARIRLPNNTTTADFNGNIAFAATATFLDTPVSRVAEGVLRVVAPTDLAALEFLGLNIAGGKSYFQTTISGVFDYSIGVRQGTTALVINDGNALGGTDLLTITSTSAAFNATLSATRFTSTIATGTAPFVVSSTTKVDNLHVARATLADTVTTNANLTGDVTSVGNATTLAAGSASNLNSGTLPAARMPALTGDITTSSGAVATTLATVNSNVGTFGSATAAATVTVNAKGLVTAASNTTVTPAVGSITGLGTNVGTALAVNVGSAGAVVVQNGALGTPSSGTLTNCTGMPKADVMEAPLFAEDAGANDTYTATLSPAITGYVTGCHYRFKANTANTGAASINFNGLGAVTIVKVAGGITTALADNDIRAGQWVDLVYDGTNMQMQSTLGNAASGGSSPTTTRGDLIRRGASADERLAIDLFGSRLTSNGTDPVWSREANFFELFDDFVLNLVHGSLGPSLGWQTVTITNQSGSAGHPGQVGMSSGIATGVAFIATGFTGITLGGGATLLTWSVRTPDALSDATNDYELRVGFGDTTSANNGTDGLFFVYSHDINSGNWTGRSVEASSATDQTDDTDVAVEAATWYRLEILVNAGATQADFYVTKEGAARTHVGSLTTNIPSGTAMMGISTWIARIAGTVGAGLRLDYVRLNMQLTTQR